MVLYAQDDEHRLESRKWKVNKDFFPVIAGLYP